MRAHTDTHAQTNMKTHTHTYTHTCTRTQIQQAWSLQTRRILCWNWTTSQHTHACTHTHTHKHTRARTSTQIDSTSRWAEGRGERVVQIEQVPGGTHSLSASFRYRCVSKHHELYITNSMWCKCTNSNITNTTSKQSKNNSNLKIKSKNIDQREPHYLNTDLDLCLEALDIGVFRITRT